MENYLMLNGKRIDLTAEQIETLVGKKEKDPFERVEHNCAYCFIDTDGKVEWEDDVNISYDVERYEAGNYCTDRELMEQRALHVILNQQLWRYSMQNGGKNILYGESTAKYFIYWHMQKENLSVEKWFSSCALGVVHFDTEDTAKSAIEEIVKPFMEKHPEFRW